jgi:hypothetical protein
MSSVGQSCDTCEEVQELDTYRTNLMGILSTLGPSCICLNGGLTPGCVGLIAGTGAKGQVVCRACETGRAMTRVALPYVLKYLVTELAAMNIKCTFSIAQ